MEAKCPDCFGKNADCIRCIGKGFVDIPFATGQLYTRACLNSECAYENGGYIVSEDLKKGPDGEPPESSGVCILCNNPTRWKHLGEMDDDG